MSRLTCGHIQHTYSWWWVRLSPETCRVKSLRRIKTQLLHLLGLISLPILQSMLSVLKSNSLDVEVQELYWLFLFVVSQLHSRCFYFSTTLFHFFSLQVFDIALCSVAEVNNGDLHFVCPVRFGGLHERQTSLHQCQFWVTLQNGCNHHKQVLCLFNQLGLQFFFAKLKSSGQIDFAVGGLLSLQPLYILLQYFLAPFQGHLKISEVNLLDA